MAEKNRASQMKRGLSFTFTILTWVTVAPAVLVGLTATGLFAFLRSMCRSRHYAS